MMIRSECIISNLLFEVDSLNERLVNIKQAYCNTSHDGLRKRLFYENKNISIRLEEINKIAKVLKNRSIDKISLSSLLVEKTARIIAQKRMKENLFFL